MTSITFLAGDYLPPRLHLQYHSHIHNLKQSRLEKNNDEADFYNMRAFEEDESEDCRVGKAFPHVITWRSNIYQHLWL